MNKKVLSLILAGAMVIPSAMAVSAEEEPVTINLTRATFNLGSVDADKTKQVQDAINEYIADKINVQINLTDIVSGEYTDKVNLALTGHEIDLLWTASWEAVIGTNDLVPNKAVYDITDLLPGTPLYESMDEGQWEATKYDGKNYFVPVYKDNVEGYDFMFRKDLVDEFEFDITTVNELADLEPYLALCKEKGLKYPFLTQKTDMFYRWFIDKYDFFTADAKSSFIAIDRESNEVVNVVATEDYANFAKLMGTWAEAGYIHSDDYNKLTTDTTTQTQDWGVSWWTDIPVNAEANSRYGQDVVMQPATDRWAHSTSALGSCYAITTEDPVKAQAAIDFLGLLYTDKTLADMYTFGIEGEDFEYVTEYEGETYEIPHVLQHSDLYNHSMWESASATIVTPIVGEPDNKAELYKDFNGGANTSGAAGFRFDKTPVEAAYTACQSVYEEYGFQLSNGGIPADEVDDVIAEYQEALDEAGYQSILDEFSAQYEAWKGGAEEEVETETAAE